MSDKQTDPKDPGAAPDPSGEQVRERWVDAALGIDAHDEVYRVLSMMLTTAVPLRIMRILDRGGVTPEDFKRVAGYDEEVGRADAILSGAAREGDAASWFNKVAEAMAVLSFVPGGIELFGLRYESLPLQRLVQQKAAETAERAGGGGERA